MSMISVKNLDKTFDMKSFEVHALKDINLEVNSSEFIGLIGPSGSGKTTLINTISGLIKPTKGRIMIDGVNITDLSTKELREFRLKNVGMVFQEHLLIGSLTALENVTLPLIFLKIAEKERIERAEKLLDEFGLLDKKDHLPSELSGGQQQRLGIARALITGPKILLADEPTGNIDMKSAKIVMETIQDVVKTKNTCVIMVSHNPQHRSRFDRVFELQDGAFVNN